MSRLTKQRLRILDALVAEHIFGWKWFSALGDAFLIPPHGQEECRRFSVHWTEGLREKSRACKKRYDIEMHYREYARWETPHYTSNKAAAFDILEHFGKSNPIAFWQSHEKETKGYWLVYKQDYGIYGIGETLPLAAVLFALKLNHIELPWKLKQKPSVKAV